MTELKLAGIIIKVMAKKHINSSSGVVIGSHKIYKPKAKAAWIEGPVSRRVRLERERGFWLNNVRDRKDIEEYVAFMKNEWRKQDAR